MVKVERDLDRDLFRIQVDGTWEAHEAKILATVKETGFKPTRVEGQDFGKPLAKKGDGERPPKLIVEAIERAKKEGKKYLLVDATGKG